MAKSSQIEWQTKAMGHAVKHLKGTQREYVKLEPDKSLNDEVKWDDELQRMIQAFAPRIRLIGWGLWSERFGLRDTLRKWLGRGKEESDKAPIEYGDIKSWGGAYARAIKNKDDSWRCLQYLYIYTRQKGTISFLWNVVVPGLMAAWGFVLPWLFNSFAPGLWRPGFTLEKSLALGGICLVLFYEGFRPHLYDAKYSQEETALQFRATTMLMPFSLALFLSSISDVFLYGLMVGVAFFAVVWILEHLMVLPSAHKMDYVPVFVWVAREEQQDLDEFYQLIGTDPRLVLDDRFRHVWLYDSQWMPICVTWDDGHYRAKTLRYAHPDKRDPPVLDMRDSWHSLGGGPVEPGLKARYREFWSIYVPLLFVTLVLYYIVIDPASQFVYNWVFFPLTFVPLIILAVSLAILSHRSVLVPDRSYSYLDEDKRNILWNLRESSRLKIITKLQNPFMFFDTKTARVRAVMKESIPCFETFNVEPLELLAMMEKMRKARMDLLLMVEEILQIDAKARTPYDIERAVRKYADRRGTQFTEDDVQEMIVMMCNVFII